MKNENLIFKIPSKYCLKAIFSYIDYKTILKLVKCNKELQNKLDLSKKDYNLDCRFIKRIEKTKTLEIDYEVFNCNCIVSAILKFILFIYQSIVTLIFLIKDEYKEFDADNNKISIIRGYNIFLCFFFNIYILFSIIFLFLELKLNSSFSWLLIISNLLIYIFVLSMLIWVTILNFEIEAHNYNWSVICDIILGIFYFFVIVSLLSLNILFLIYYRKEIIVKKILIKRFKGIQIKDFEIDRHKYKEGQYNFKNYLLSLANRFEVEDFPLQNYIINSINDVREKYNLPLLNHNKHIPYFLINLNPDIEFDLKNIFRLKWKYYLFKYKESNFKNEFNIEDKEIKNLLSIPDLNTIGVIEKYGFIYIFIFDDRRRNIMNINAKIKISEDKLGSKDKFDINN